jgi:hypothetical protein
MITTNYSCRICLPTLKILQISPKGAKHRYAQKIATRTHRSGSYHRMAASWGLGRRGGSL